MTKDEALQYLKRKIGTRSYLKVKDGIYKMLDMYYPKDYKNYINMVIGIGKVYNFTAKRVEFSKNRMDYKYRDRMR